MHMLMPTRFRLPLLSACLATLVLQGCGGDDSDDPTPAPVVKNTCANTPAVTPQRGYPIYEMKGDNVSETDVCTAVAHYEAGYAIVASGEIDPWTEADEEAVVLHADVTTSAGVPGQEAVVTALQDAAVTAAHTSSSSQRGFLLAQRPGGLGDPKECSVIGATPEQVTAALEDCLSELRQAQRDEDHADASANRRVASSSAKTTDGNLLGNATPDTKAWTQVGETTTTLKAITAPLIGSGELAGSATLTFTLYRLNSVTGNDYYLVQGKWSVTPQMLSRADCSPSWYSPGYCRFFNNFHQVGFNLQRNVKGLSPQSAVIMEHAPETALRDTTVSNKIGGGLAVGKDGPSANVSSEVATSYSYTSADIIGNVSDNSLQFQLSHAASKSDLKSLTATTLGGMTTTLWGLFRLPALPAEQAKDASVTLNVTDFAGNFGAYLDCGIGPCIDSRSHHHYFLRTQPGTNTTVFTRTFPLPEFEVDMIDTAGKVQQLPSEPANALRLRRGDTITLHINKAGSADNPLALPWELTTLPSTLIASRNKGNGKGTVSITVKSDAAVGTLDYLRINTVPPASASSLQFGDIAVPVRIVQ